MNAHRGEVMGSADKEKPKVELNNVRKIREGLLMSKAELARRAKLSVLTIDRVEKGMACRMDTKRKIILSLGLKLSDRDKVFKI
jgi:DNA-binding XRE family transcriptional regulator